MFLILIVVALLQGAPEPVSVILENDPVIMQTNQPPAVLPSSSTPRTSSVTGPLFSEKLAADTSHSSRCSNMLLCM